MSARPPLPEGPALVVGLARSGRAALRALRDVGVAARGVDAGAARDGFEGLDVAFATDGLAALDDAAWLVKSPGVPPRAPVVAAARERGMVVMGELELAWRLLDGHPLLAVTGTNGKTTTTELLGAMHRAAGVGHEVVGNVGRAACELVGELAAGAVLVCEASSYQLHDTVALAPDAAALVNLGSDHLDWHGTLAAYHEAKRRAFARQGPDALAVVPDGLEVGGAARRVRFGGRDAADVHPAEGWVVAFGERVVALGDLALRGPHNLQNALCATGVALGRGLARDAVAEALATFRGVAHRLEEVAHAGGVLYVNDSKATNVEAAVVGVRAFADRGRVVRLLAGGQGPVGDLAPLAAAADAACASVHVFGEEADVLDAALRTALGGRVERAGDLPAAFAAADRAARAGNVVLLSPACKSFDAFRDFEERGDAFRALAQEAARRR